MDKRMCHCGQSARVPQVNQDKSKSVGAYTSALDTGLAWSVTTLLYYFYTTSDTGHTDGGGETLRNWPTAAADNYRIAIAEWEKVCGLTLTETNDINVADIFLILIDDVSYPFLGHAYFPEGANAGQNYVSYNNAADKQFTVGSYDYITMVHEFGHTLGLAHPHDTGGASTTFPGVSSWFDVGTNEQNQTMFTVMSYNDVNGPLTPDAVQSFGFIKGPMAYDIKTVQLKYPGTVSTAPQSFVLPSINAIGTYYECLVSGGAIVSNSNSNTFISLRPATVDGAVEGGGAVSKIAGVQGGFTIAQGTTVANAVSAGGNDTLIGNAASNRLFGGAGNDLFLATPGQDRYVGHTGFDRVYFPYDRADYSVTRFPTHDAVFRKVEAADRAELVGIERVRFRDGPFHVLRPNRYMIGRGTERHTIIGERIVVFEHRRVNYRITRQASNRWLFVGVGVAAGRTTLITSSNQHVFFKGNSRFFRLFSF